MVLPPIRPPVPTPPPTKTELQDQLDFLVHEYSRFKADTYVRMTQFEREIERLKKQIKSHVFQKDVKGEKNVYNYTHEKYSYQLKDTKDTKAYKTIL